MQCLLISWLYKKGRVLSPFTVSYIKHVGKIFFISYAFNVSNKKSQQNFILRWVIDIVSLLTQVIKYGDPFIAMQCK